MSEFDQSFWDAHYIQGATGWDIGYASPQLVGYFDQLKDKRQRILIPGAGYGHEAAYLLSKGFLHVNVLDISELPLQELRKVTGDPEALKCYHEDFFFHSGNYELIVEQTFFCAIHPKERSAYVAKVFEMLEEGGTLVGLIWGVPMNSDRPPFGGSIQEYEALFGNLFEIEVLEEAKYSIKPRAGREVFVVIKKPITQ